MSDKQLSRTEPTFPMGGQVWKHKLYGGEVWILSTSVEGVRFKTLNAPKDEKSVVTSESDFTKQYKFERWRV